MLEIVVEEGIARGERVALDRVRIAGRDGGCDIPIKAGAGRQALFDAYPPTLTDLAGDGGTAVNGVPLLAESILLCAGDRVRLGATLLRLCEPEPSEREECRVREPEATYGAREHARSGGAGLASDVEIVARSAAMQEVVRVVRRVARSDVTVLLTGESGTGKDVIARALHASGPRADRPFHAVNVAAFPESLLEAELFGHERGAFTGAHARRSGLFEVSHGGTVFLDELGEMSPAIQAKLLRVLESGEFQRLGSSETRRANVRVLAATNRDLRARAKEGFFREDLYYRLAVVEIRMPPLRERREDIEELCVQLLARASRERGLPAPVVEPEALALLRAYPFPGNVRELRNLLERARLLGDGARIRAEDLPDAVRFRTGSDAPSDIVALVPLSEMERRHIIRALELTGWNKSRAAALLGIDRKTLYAKIAQHGIAREEPPADPPRTASEGPKAVEDLVEQR